MNPIRSAIASSLPLIAMAVGAFPNEARAVDEVAVRDGESASIVISAHDLTRLSMTDGVRLEKLFGAEGVLEIKADVDSGAAFIKPTDPDQVRTLSFFVRDERGATYTLVASVGDLPGRTILLRPTGRAPAAKRKASARTEPFMRQVKALVRAMAAGTSTDDFSIEAIGRDVPLWAQVRTVLEQLWSGGSGLEGEIWRVRNATKGELRLDESQFANLYPDVRAVSIALQKLAPGSSTLVYVVRGGQGAGS